MWTWPPENESQSRYVIRVGFSVSLETDYAMPIRNNKSFFSTSIIQESPIEERTSLAIFDTIEIESMNEGVPVWKLFILKFYLCDCPGCVDGHCMFFMLLFPCEFSLVHVCFKSISKFQLYPGQETIVTLCLVNDLSYFDIFVLWNSLEFGKLAIARIYISPLYWRRRVR